MLYFFLLLLFFFPSYTEPLSRAAHGAGRAWRENCSSESLPPTHLVQRQGHEPLRPDTVGTLAPRAAENTLGLSQEGGKHRACHGSLSAVGKTGPILYLSVLTAARLE